MDYTLTHVPSLERLALVRTTITLWNQDRDLLLNHYLKIISRNRVALKEKRQEIEAKVKEKVLQLPLPEALKDKILVFIRPIGLEILYWKRYHTYWCLGIDLPNELCWSPHGTVDGMKTAEVLIKDEDMHIAKRYRLACMYCLEDDIPELWEKMPESCKQLYKKKEPRRDHGVVIFWTYYINGNVTELNKKIEEKWRPRCTMYQFAFECAVCSCNKESGRYFLQKLTSSEREVSLKRTIRGLALKVYCQLENNFPNLNTAVLCFLLSQINENDLLEMFNVYSHEFLRCLLQWPWQDFFMETAKRSWAFHNHFVGLLHQIICKVIDGYMDYDYLNLFREMLQLNSTNSRKHFIGIHDCVFLLPALFQVKDKESIKLILDYMSTPEREKYVFSHEGRCIYESLICNDDSDLLKFFVRECLSSKVIKIKFEKLLNRRVRSRPEKEKHLWNKFCQLLDDLIQEDDNKTGEEESNINPAKKLCTLTSKQLR